MTAHRHEVTNWAYQACPLETASDRFGPFAGFARLWRTRWTAEGRPPARDDFDFADFKGWWGRIAIARFEHDPFDVRFVLWGTLLAYWWSVDYTDRPLGAASPDRSAWTRTEGRYFEAMADRPFIGIAWGSLAHYRHPELKVMSIDLPLCDDGNVTHVLMAHRQIGVSDNPQTVMPDCPGEAFEFFGD